MDLDTTFLKAALFWEKGPRARTLSSADDELLYGLYKQASVGPCNEPRPLFSGRAKWEAWSRLGTMSRDDAMRHFTDRLQEKYTDWEHWSGFDHEYREEVERIEQATARDESYQLDVRDSIIRKLEALEYLIEVKNSVVQKLDERLTTVERDNALKEDKIESLKGANEAYSGMLKQKEDELDDHKDKLRIMEAEKKAQEELRSRPEIGPNDDDADESSESVKWKSEAQRLATNLALMEETKKSIDQEVVVKAKERDRMKLEVDRLTHELSIMERGRKKADNEIAEKNRQLVALKERNAELEADLQAYRGGRARKILSEDGKEEEPTAEEAGKYKARYEQQTLRVAELEKELEVRAEEIARWRAKYELSAGTGTGDLVRSPRVARTSSLGSLTPRRLALRKGGTPEGKDPKRESGKGIARDTPEDGKEVEAEEDIHSEKRPSPKASPRRTG